MSFLWMYMNDDSVTIRVPESLCCAYGFLSYPAVFLESLYELLCCDPLELIPSPF